MPINSNIPLLAQPPQWGQNFQQDLLQVQRNKEEAPFRQRLLEAQTSDAELQNTNAKQQQLQDEDRSVMLGSAAIQQFLNRNDVAGAKAYLTQRKAQLSQLGLNTAHTDQALQLIDQDPNQLKTMVDANVDIGTRLGVFGKAAAPTNEQQNLHALGYTEGTPEYSQAFQRLYGKPDPNTITPYQQAQLNMESAKLAWEREKAAKGEGAKPPSGYRANSDGSLSFIPGGPADPNAQPKHNLPTEGQAKANAFVKEMEAALVDIDAARAEAGSAEPGLLTQAAGNLPLIGKTARALVSSPAEQKYLNGMRRFITAKLRADSGATITQGEINEQLDQTLPKLTDSAEVVAQKRAALDILVESVRSRGTSQPGGSGAAGATAAQQGAPSGIQEGATATNPQTGAKVVFKEGQWQPL